MTSSTANRRLCDRSCDEGFPLPHSRQWDSSRRGLSQEEQSVIQKFESRYGEVRVFTAIYVECSVVRRIAARSWGTAMGLTRCSAKPAS